MDILQNVSSIQWKRRYFTTGEFEIHCRATETNLKYLRDPYRIVNNETQEIGFIRYTYPSISDDGQDEMEVRGYMDNLDHRVNTKTRHITNVETGLYNLVNANIRYLPIAIAPTKGLSATVDHDTTWQELRTTFQELCMEVGYGYRILKNGSTMNQIEIYERGINENVKFSDKIGNIIAQAYLLDTADWKNYAYVAAEGESSQRFVIEIDQRKYSYGERRRELYVDARQIQRKYTDESGQEREYTEEEYRNVVRDYGLQKLKEHNRQILFECDINANDTLYTYKKDYFLGDVIRTVSEKYGLNTLMRITGVDEILEDDTRVNLILEQYEE